MKTPQRVAYGFRTWLLPGLLLALVIIIAGCGNNNPSDATPAKAVPAEPAPANAAPAQPAVPEPVAVQAPIVRPAALEIPAAAPSPAPPPAAPPAVPGKPRIGIMKFDLGGNLDPALGKFLYNELTGKMVESGKFTVVDWEEIDRVLNYVAKSQPNLSPEEAKKQAINQLGLEKMYVGSVAKIGSKFQVNVKLLKLDLTVERVEKGSADSEDELESIISRIAAAFASNPEELAKSKEIEDAWKTASELKTEEGYRSFLARYPSSSYASLARARVEKSKKDADDAARKEDLKKEKDQLLFRVARWLNEEARLDTAKAGENAAHYLKDFAMETKDFENFKEVFKWFGTAVENGGPNYANSSTGYRPYYDSIKKAEDYVFERKVDIEKFRKDFKEVFKWFGTSVENGGPNYANSSTGYRPYYDSVKKAEDYIFEKKITPQQFSELKAKYRQFKDLKLAEASVFGQ